MRGRQGPSPARARWRRGRAAAETSGWRFAGLAVGRRADLLSVARGAHHTRESRVAIPGAGITARGDPHALAIADEQ